MQKQCIQATGWFIDSSKMSEFGKICGRLKAIASHTSDPFHKKYIEEAVAFFNILQAQTVYLPVPEVVDVEVVL